MISVRDQLKVFKFKVINVCHFRVDLQNWERLWYSLQLLFKRFDVILVYVSVPYHMNEFSSLQSTNLSNHASQKRVTCYVKRYSKTHVGWSLIHLTRELAIRDVELSENMAWRKSHLLDVSNVPSTEQYSSWGWVLLDELDNLFDLIDSLAGVIRFEVLVLGSKVSPLEAIYRSQISLFSLREPTFVQELSTSISIPNVNLLVSKIVWVGISF